MVRKHLVVPEGYHDFLYDYNKQTGIPITKLVQQVFDSSTFYKKIKKEMEK